MAIIDERLARKGKGQPRQAVLQQARILQKLGADNQVALAEHGWDAADNAQFATDIGALEAALGNRSTSNVEAEHSTKSEQAALDDVKAFLRKLRSALPRVLRKNGPTGITVSSFVEQEPVRRSTPKAIAHLIKIRSFVVALDEPLKKFFQGKKASDELDAVKTALEQADTHQESAQAAGPADTQTLHEAVGRVLEGIEDLNRTGKIAFERQATKAALFNKDLILRARAKKGAPDEEPDEPAPAEAGTNTP